MAASHGGIPLRIMAILSEPIGSIPRPASLIEAIVGFQAGKTTAAALEAACAEALRDTIARFEQTGIDFTEARLSLKLDPTGGLLHSFVALNNQVLDRFTSQDRQRIGVHVCPRDDHDSTHSADIDYAGLLPELFRMKVGRFYLQIASEPDKKRVLSLIRQLLQPNHIVFVGVTDPINPTVETAAEVRDRVLEAASLLPVAQLGTTDDCGFAPFADDTSTSRDIAFSKIRAGVEGTDLAAHALGA
jgi:5-methyltetrahydropteroyltriglutamate--homocysteine methyltransferase